MSIERLLFRTIRVYLPAGCRIEAQRRLTRGRTPRPADVISIFINLVAGLVAYRATVMHKYHSRSFSRRKKVFPEKVLK